MSDKQNPEGLSCHDEYNRLKKLKQEFEFILDLNVHLTELDGPEEIMNTAALTISSGLKKKEGMVYWLDRPGKRITGSFWLPENAPKPFSVRLDKEGRPLNEAETSVLGKVFRGFIAGAYERLNGTYKALRHGHYVIVSFGRDQTGYGEIVVFERRDENTSFDGDHIPRLYEYLGAMLKSALVRIRLAKRVVETEAVAKNSLVEKERMEQEIIRAQKLESLGLLAGGIAHDFNNILTAISGNISLAKMYLKPDEKAFQKLIKAEKAFSQAKELTRQLLTFSRKGGSPVKKAVSIVGLIKDSVQFTFRGSNVYCDCAVPKDLYSVEVDEGQMGQVINNLLINAEQAMPEGGTVCVRAENVTLGPDNRHHLSPGKYVKISVKDHGVGIPENIIMKIFDPYFTTKRQGNGLGLATVYSIIKKHNGAIDVESEAEKGSAFHVYLPAFKGTTWEKGKREGEPTLSGKEKILIMDDEEEIRNVLGEMLESIGYKVDFAKNGMEAIESVRSAKESRNPFDAVILDLTVPGAMGGKEAIQELRTIAPDLKAIVSSGYVNDPVMANYKTYGFSDVIPKPFEISRLSRVLRDTLAGQKKLN